MKTPKTKTSGIKGLGFYIFPLLVVLILAFGMNKLNPAVEHTYTDALTQIEAGNAKTVVVNGQTLIVTLNTAIDDKGVTKELRVMFPYEWSKDLYAALQKAKADGKIAGFNYTAPADYSLWMTIIPFLLMLGLMVFLWMTFMRQSNDGKNAMSFGRSKARLNDPAKNKITFRDVAGADEEKEELKEVVDFLKNPKKYSELGARIPKGMLLVGPPGTGKTLLAKAVAGEAGVPFFSISGSDFVEMFVGVGASRVRDLFDNAKKNSPCIVFIDEIDAVGRHRGAGMGGGHDEREQTLNQLLVEMDGFESNEGVIIIAATNRPDVLDPAILRPGRFDRRIVVPRPDVRGREGILRVHTKKVPLAHDVDLEILARGTPGFVGADLENLVNEAALLAARQDKDAVAHSDFEMAKDKVLMGTERRSMVMSEEERRIAAWHEAGHTLAGKFVPGNDSVHKVTIIPRGAALGVTQFLPTEDRHMMTREQALARIAMALGGRTAEEIAFGEITTGASDDIRRATQIARSMVCEVGMSDKLGPIAYGDKEESVFLGRDFAQRHQDYSEQTAQSIDQEVRRIVEEQHTVARNVLTQHRTELDAIAHALLERETLDAEEIQAAIDGRPLPQRERIVIPSWGDRDKAQKDKRRAATIFGAPKPATSG